MLSGETAAGKYPADALAYMRRIVEAAESPANARYCNAAAPLKTDNVTDAIAHATCTIAKDLNAAAIIAVTSSGFCARQIASRQPDCPILALTYKMGTYYRLRLYRGVFPVMNMVSRSGDELFAQAARSAFDSGLVREGGCVVITGGLPLGVSGTTNMLKVEYL
jgi:pyruvate kinase